MEEQSDDSSNSSGTSSGEEDFTTPCIIFNPNSAAVYIETKDGFDFSAALESVFPLVDLICFYLDFKDLESVSQVSKVWKESAGREARKRNQLSCIKSVAGVDSKYKGLTNNYSSASKQYAIFFVPATYLRRFVCCHPEGMHSDSIYRKQLYPHIQEDLLKPNDVDYICLSLHSLKTFVDKNQKCLYSGYYFPKIPNVRIKHFSFPQKLVRKMTVFDEYMKDDEIVDCLLIFSTSYQSTNIQKAVKELNKRQSTPASLGGGIIWGVQGNFPRDADRVVRSRTCYCIAFLKKTNEDSSFYSASMVINFEDCFEEKAKELRKAVVIKESSVIFRICCTAKNDGSSEEPILKKLFPNSELIQFNVNGEIGMNHIPNLDNTEDKTGKKKRKHAPDVYHEYSTVLVFLTWNNFK